MGGQQPYEPRQLLPPTGTPADNPPLLGPRKDAAALAYYAQPDTIIQIVLFDFPGAQGDQPTIQHPGRNPLPWILKAWEPGPPAPWNIPPRQTISGPVASVPNFSQRLWQTLFETVVFAWQPPPPQPTQLVNHPLRAFQVDNPQFADAGRNPLFGIVAAWQPGPPQPKTANIKFTAGAPPPVAGPRPPDSHLGLPIILGI